MTFHGFRWTKREDHLHEYGAEVQRAAKDIIGKGVLDLQAHTVLESNVDTGQMKAGWQAVMPQVTGNQVVGGVGTNVEHATYQELGTGRRGAGSRYPFPRAVRYTMAWPGITARAMLGNAAAKVLPPVRDALGRLGGRMRQL